MTGPELSRSMLNPSQDPAISCSTTMKVGWEWVCSARGIASSLSGIRAQVRDRSLMINGDRDVELEPMGCRPVKLRLSPWDGWNRLWMSNLSGHRKCLPLIEVREKFPVLSEVWAKLMKIVCSCPCREMAEVTSLSTERETASITLNLTIVFVWLASKSKPKLG